MKLHKTWWGEAFFSYLISFIDEGRLKRGRAYRTDRRILAFEIQDNIVKATVRGNKNPYFGVYKEPKYKVKISFKKIPEWKEAVKTICDHPGWLSKLMLNEIPGDIDKAFVKNSLLPKDLKDITTDCSCPDYENPCKHIAGVYYRIAEALDNNPMLLFSIHGLSIEELQTELKKNDLGKSFAEQLSTSQEVEIESNKNQFYPITNKSFDQHLTQNSFWNMQDKWDIDKEHSQEPISASIVKKQGDYPQFWSRHNSFILAMESIYNYVRIKNKKILL